MFSIKALPAYADEDTAKEEVVLRLNSTLARCIQLLFGVTLPDRNMDWGAPHVRHAPACLSVCDSALHAIYAGCLCVAQCRARDV